MFQYVDAFGRRQTVSSDDVNERLRELSGRDVTAKDFRTWGGTMHAAIALRAMGPAASRREADRNIIRAIDVVAERLGNTRAVCRKYYVHPAIVEAYLLGRTAALPREAPANGERRGRGAAALRRDEIAVLQFLHDELDGNP
jgi:DNA topoisomerase-1